jgi:gliding motility-associated protein GldE
LEPPSLVLSVEFLSFFKPLSVELLPAVFVSILLLACSALISGSEVAYFSLSPGDKEELNNDNTPINERILALVGRPHRLLATILIANNFVNIGIVILSSYIVSGIFDFTQGPTWLAITIQVGVVTFLLLLLGEVIPKVYATINGMKLCKIMAIPLQLLLRLFYPLSSLLISSTNLINKRIKKRDTEYSPDALEHAIDLTRDDETTPEDEKILKGIVRFGGTDVKQIMTPRTEVVSFDLRTPYSETLDGILKEGYSRVPIYKDSLDQVMGMLYLKDLLPYADKKDMNWQSLLRSPYFVPENKKLDDLLKEFQEKKVHMAVVVDEYGGTSGIVSLEDILEEIVGEITDEFDDEDIYYSKLDDSNYIFEGKTPLIDLYKILDIDGENFEREKGESDTLAGFILELTGKFPVKSEKIPFENFMFSIETADKRRIKRVKLTILEPEQGEDD